MFTLVPVTELLIPAVQWVRVGDGGAVLGAKVPKVTLNNKEKENIACEMTWLVYQVQICGLAA